MMTPDEMIAVLEAHKRGEEIEATRIGSNDWRKVVEPYWDFLTFEYRVAKPEPKRIKMFAYIHKDSGRMTFSYTEFPARNWYRAPWLDGEVEE